MRMILLALCVWLYQASADAQSCQSLILAQGFLVPEQESYEHGSEVSYGCNSGLKSAIKTWWGVIKCENGEWSHTPQCIAISDCVAPVVPHATPVKPVQVSYSTNSRVAFACDKGYGLDETDLREALCENGEWKLPVCKRKPAACDAPSRVANAVITQPSQDTFEHTERVEYRCKKGYELDGQKYSYCVFNVWTSAPKCVPSGHVPIPARPAPPVRNCDTHPIIENGDVIEGPGGLVLTVQCTKLYTLLGPQQVRCVNGQWSELPVCKAACRLDQAMFYFPEREYMLQGEEEVFFCSRFSTVQVKCDDGRALYRGCGRNEW